HRVFPSFPTRRSSDLRFLDDRECVSASAANEFAELDPVGRASRQSFFGALPGSLHGPLRTAEKQRGVAQRLTHARESDDFCSTVDRKSTRLNSSHDQI